MDILGIVTSHHAKNFSIDIKSLKVIVEAKYDTAEFEGKYVKAGMHKIEAKIVNSPNSIDELRKFFKFVEKHCPIGDTLSSTTPLSDSVEKEELK